MVSHTPASGSPSTRKLKPGEKEDERFSSKRRNGSTNEAAPPVPPTCSAEPAVPSTPALRIPLADLIANTEDAFNRTPPAGTPKDHVLWQSNLDSSDASAAGVAQRRNGKRSRSLSPSPVASQRGNAAATSLPPPLNKPLRTPNQDPTLDLWSRYTAAHALKQDQIEPAVSPHDFLMPSSPQTPSTNGKDAGMRRTHSCGIGWPTSKSKRRRLATNGQHSRTKELFATSRREILRHDLSNNTRVGLLLEKIQESLTKKPPGNQSPSSSSPLPDRSPQMLTSPTKMAAKGVACECGSREPSASPMPRRSNDNQDLQSESFCSDFSDNGLDVEEFEKAEEALAQVLGRGELRPADQKGGFQYPGTCPSPAEDLLASGKYSPGECRRQLPQPLQPNPGPVEPVREDCEEEFSVDDDEDLMNEMLDLAAQYDVQQPATMPKTMLNHSHTDTGPQATPARLQSLDEFENAFDDDDDDDELWEGIANATLGNPSTTFGPSNDKPLETRAIKRFLVADVFESQYEYKPGRTRPEKLLSVKEEKSSMLCIICLRGSWYDTRCTKGSYVHLIGKFDNRGQCVVDDDNNMVILHPDHLISSTVVGDSFTCIRRAVLQDRVKATSAATQPQVYGHIIHEVFGEALRLNRWDQQTFGEIIDKVLPSHLEPLYEIGVRESDAKLYLLSKTPELMAWASVFVVDTLSPDAVIRDRNGILVPTAITKLLELEEHIWSPMYGLKGNIDATVQVQMKLPADPTAKTLLVPFELKTGKKDNVGQHRAQTALYTLLLSDRYDLNVTCGILYYTETSKTFRVEGVRNEIRHMLIQRNELACYVHDKLALPPMIKKEHLCKTCYSKAACFIYHKLSEKGTLETAGVGQTFNDLVGHLTAPDQSFFKKWDDLLTIEERDAMKMRRELWTMLSPDRESLGRCFSEVVIQKGTAVENPERAKINRFEYTFIKQKPRPGFSFAESQITVGEPIVISDEKGHFNFAAGFVTIVRPDRLTVAVDRRLRHVRIDSSNNEITHVATELDVSGGANDEDPQAPVLYRIDKDEFANGLATARNNIIRLMEKDLWRARELRELIIHNKSPEFKLRSTGYVLSGPLSQQALNADQQRAIEKVMNANDYALVLGMPGTGKTTTIAHIIRALVGQGKSVLLASYTHTAVDNILLKIRDDNIRILRIGAINKVHPDVRSFADVSGIPKQSMEDLHVSWQESQVVATTCLGVNHGIFNARTFDYCIVDEASQITLPVCLGPIRMAKTFILVGDHYQLPPLVQNKEALEGGLDVSLFKLLSDAQPESVVNLEHQYRMAEDIMLLSKELVYSGRIKCGTEAVALRTLHIPDLERGLADHHMTASSVAPSGQSASFNCHSGNACWIRRALSPSSRCLFLNTDLINSTPFTSRETTMGSRVTNAVESSLTAQLVTTLIHSGVPPRTIGVITFYRSQVALLKSDLKSMVGSVAAGEVEMHTADKYQGRDKEVVILSCVRSNDNRHVGELLKDWRRVNVAVTRARSKLLMLGSRSTLEGSGVPILQGLIKLVARKDWVLDLPSHACASHVFDAGSQGLCVTQPKFAPQSKPATADPPSSRLGMRSGDNSSSAKLHSALHPAKQGRLKQPEKVVRGSKISGNVEAFLDTRPILKDVVQGLSGTASDAAPEHDKENVNLDVTDHEEMDLDEIVDASFDPSDFIGF